MQSKILPARVASRILRQTLGLHRGQSLLIEGWTGNLPLAEVFWLEARRMGIRPALIVQPEQAFFDAQSAASPKDAIAVSRAGLAALRGADGYLLLYGPSNFPRFERLPRARRAEVARWGQVWNQELHRWRIPSVHFYVADATPENSQRYGVSLARWRRECARGSLVRPRVLQRSARPWMRALHGRTHVVITHANGTHLELDLNGYPPMLQDGVVDDRKLREGRVWAMMPAGVVMVPFDGGSAEGRFVANRPSRHLAGTIGTLDWTFRKGRLVRYGSHAGRALFRSKFVVSGRERTRPAVLSIGLNPEIHDTPFAEDQEKGVVSLYLGHNDDLGGTVGGSYREFALLRGATVRVDGEVLLRSGRFT